MANPFLMNDDDLSPKADMASNPFLMQESQDPGIDDEFAGDNPFLAQANNPFAAFGEDESEAAAPTTMDELSFYPAPPPPIDETNMFHSNEPPTSVAVVPTTATVTANQNEIDSVMSFFGTTISDDLDESHHAAPIKPVALNIHKEALLSTYDDQMAYSSEDELSRDQHRTAPPPRPSLPPSRTTQDLILSVADQLDQTSSHLLGRIPATRTPSPVSMRDLHSPSPTPDLCDLLDVSDEPIADFMNPDPENQFMSNDNPFMMTTPVEPVMQPSPAKVEPTRPPPPTKPTPPRPTPPRRPSPPQVVTAAAAVPAPAHKQPPPPRPAAIQPQPQPEPDLFDMFGSEDVAPAPKPPQKPPPPKSNQDILNLFAAPAAAVAPTAPQPSVVQQEFDILSMDHVPGMDELPPTLMTSGNTTSMHPAPAPPPPLPEPPQQQQSLLMQHITKDDALQLPPPSIELEESPTPEWSDDNEDEQQMDDGSSAVVSPAASDEPMTDVVASSATTTPPHVTEKENILDEIEHSVIDSSGAFGAVDTPVPCAMPDFSDEPAMPNMDYGITPTPSVNPFASPESEPEQHQPPAFMEPIIAPVANVPPKKPSPPPPPQRGVRSDEFDAFAAKFDSVKKEEPSLLDGFGAAVPSRSVSAEFGKIL